MEKESIIQKKTFDFSIEIIQLYKQLKINQEYEISKQLLRSSTSIGANVEEASAGQTKKDFIAKMAIASKEARETKYWLRLLDKSELVKLDYSPHIRNIEEIINILTAIVKTAQQNLTQQTI